MDTAQRIAKLHSVVTNLYDEMMVKTNTIHEQRAMGHAANNTGRPLDAAEHFLNAASAEQDIEECQRKMQRLWERFPTAMRVLAEIRDTSDPGTEEG